MEGLIGKRVIVQIPEGKYISGRNDPSRHNGRTGVVVGENHFGRENGAGGLWEVDLDATNRSKRRTESFHGDDLKEYGD